MDTDTFGDRDRADVFGRIGECVKSGLTVGDDAHGADDWVEAEVTKKFGQTREIRFRRNHDVHSAGRHLNPEC